MPIVSRILNTAAPTAKLDAKFELRDGRTVLTDQFHTAPLKIAKTFRLPDEESALYVHMMDASPGILDGDHYDYRFELKEGGHIYLTNQSFTKIHPALNSDNRVTQHFHLAEGAVLEYFPEPIIPFRDSRFIASTEFHLAESSIAFFGEVTVPGRTHHGERFAFTSYSSKTVAFMEDDLLAWDHFCLEPAVHRFETIGALDGYTHYGTLWIWARGCDEAVVRMIREAIDGSVEVSYPESMSLSTDSPKDNPTEVAAGVSLSAKHGIAMRVLARNVWQTQAILHTAWNAARKALLGRPAPVIRR